MLPFVQYALRDGVINNVNPGVFFYYAAVLSPTSGPFVITVDQANTHSWPFIPPNQLQGILYDSSCTKVQNVTVSYEQALGVARIVVNGSYAANSTYYFSVKYSPTASYANNNGLGGFAPIGTPTVSYTYTAFVNGIDATDDASVALVPK